MASPLASLELKFEIWHLYLYPVDKYDAAGRYLEESLKFREADPNRDEDQIQETKKALEAVRDARRRVDSGTLLAKDGIGKPESILKVRAF
jgi:hypothetical protein